MVTGGILPTQGAVGTLQRAEPLDACEPLSNFLKPREASFAIIKRGNCVFDLKVWHAQQAGFQAAIVFNNEDGRELITSKSYYSHGFNCYHFACLISIFGIFISVFIVLIFCLLTVCCSSGCSVQSVPPGGFRPSHICIQEIRRNIDGTF